MQPLNNPIHALEQSISFGRFMSESLAWEKWSSFSHNRYVEEAERYSRPGSVAQKKAFFEAHYKKLAAQKAAALLEQANNEAQNNSTGQEDEGVIDNDNDTHNLQISPNSEMVVKEEQDAKVLSVTSDEHDVLVRLTASEHDSNSSVEASVTPESNKVEGAEAVMEEVAVVGSSMKVELQSHLEDVGAQKEESEKLSAIVTPPILTPIVKVSKSDQEVLASVGKKKPPVSSFKLSKANGTSYLTSTPVKSTAAISFKRDNIATPMSNKPANETSKFTTTPVKSTAAISFKRDNIVTPMSNKPANGTSKFTTTPVKSTAAISFKRDNIVTPMSNKPANGTSKFTTTPVKSTAAISFKRNNIVTPMSNKPATLSTADKKRSTPRSVNFTPIRELNRLTASVMRKFESTRAGAGSSKASKDNSTTLRTPTMASKEMQNQSSLTPLTEKKRNKTPLDLSSAPGNHTGGSKWRLLSGENRMRSPLISSPFSLRTEERATRRKKKLEEKFNANEAQKEQLHTKLKEKTETEIIRKLRQSFCFKARPLPDFYKERKTSTNETKKDPLTHFGTPKDGRKSTPSMAESKTSFPPNRPVLKNSGTKHFLGKSGRTLSHPLTSTSMIIPTHENTSPNIQNGYQTGRNLKY
uniref:TPX2 C-terminal domain-containing protein n=1 Tax=Glycine max TaxID=3847 RepID=A0A0R0EIN2_SOYBN